MNLYSPEANNRSENNSRLSFEKSLVAKINFPTRPEQVKVLPNNLEGSEKTKQPVLIVDIIPSENEGEPPAIHAEISQFSSMDTLNRPEQIRKELQHLDVIDVDGYPVMVVIDEESKEIKLVSITPSLLITKTDSAENPKEVDKKLKKIAEDLIYPPLGMNETVVLEKIAEKRPKFRSLDKAHRFWIQVISQTLRKSGLSDRSIQEITMNDEKMWQMQWEMFDTLHGYAHMSMSGESSMWQRVFEDVDAEEGGILKAVENYKMRRTEEVEEFQRNLHWPEQSIDQKTGQKVIVVDNIMHQKLNGLYEDENLQVCFELTDGKWPKLKIAFAGIRDINGDSFSPIAVLTRYMDDQYIRTPEESDQSTWNFDTSTGQEWYFSESQEINNSSRVVIILKSGGQVKSLQVSYDIVVSEYGSIRGGGLKIEDRNELIEEVLMRLEMIRRESRGELSTAKEELKFSEVIHSLVRRILANPVAIKRLDEEFGADRSKNKKLPLTNVSVISDNYVRLFMEYFNLRQATSSENDSFEENSITAMLFQRIFDNSVRARIAELVEKKNTTRKVPVTNPEELKSRQLKDIDELESKGETVSEKIVPVISKAEREELARLTQQVRNKLECLFSLSLPSYDGTYFTNHLLVVTPDGQKVSADIQRNRNDIATQLIFLSGLPSKMEQLKYIQSVVGLGPRSLFTWNRILNELNALKKEVLPHRKAEKKSRDPHYQVIDEVADEDDEMMARLGRLKEESEGDYESTISVTDDLIEHIIAEQVRRRDEKKK